LGAGVALATAGAAVAWWSEREADDAYSDYLHAAAQRRQARALARAERLDRLTGAAFLAMHAGMAVTVAVLFF